mgnify:CR=1 FL=1
MGLEGLQQRTFEVSQPRIQIVDMVANRLGHEAMFRAQFAPQ